MESYKLREVMTSSDFEQKQQSFYFINKQFIMQLHQKYFNIRLLVAKWVKWYTITLCEYTFGRSFDLGGNLTGE